MTPTITKFSFVLLVGTIATVCALCAVFWTNSSDAANVVDKYSDAERSAKDFLYYYEDHIKLERNEIRDLVTAIAEAEEEDREAVANDASSRARSKVRDDYDRADKRRVEALRMLEEVIKDDAFKDKHSAARDLKSQVEAKGATMDRMYNRIRGSNHPVVAFLLNTGKEAHSYRQGRCTVANFETGNGPADCINPCEIVEFKPDNSRARSKGRDQLDRYERGIRENQSRRTELNSRHSEFKNCPKFEKKMECYTLRPEIDDEGNYRSTSLSWSSCS